MSIENRSAQNAGILSSRCVRTALHQILIPRRRVNTFESSFAGEGSLQNNFDTVFFRQFMQICGIPSRNEQSVELFLQTPLVDIDVKFANCIVSTIFVAISSDFDIISVDSLIGVFRNF